MTLTVHLFVAETFRDAVDANQLAQAAQAVWEAHGTGAPAACSVEIAADKALRALNARYRGVDAPTDVLSFEDGTPDPETGAVYLGDIAISYPQAARQAARGGHPVAWELCLLVVHGMLHLLGYDHAEPEEKARMWAAQRAVLEALGCPLDPP